MYEKLRCKWRQIHYPVQKQTLHSDYVESSAVAPEKIQMGVSTPILKDAEKYGFR